MLSEKQKSRMHLYSPTRRNQEKTERRRADAAEVASGKAESVQERNRLLPGKCVIEVVEEKLAFPVEAD